MRVGRTIAAAVLGLLFGLFVAADLVLFGVIPLNSVVVTIVPVVGLVLGVVLGIVAGNRKQRLLATTAPGVAPAVPAEAFAPPPPPESADQNGNPV